MFGPGLGYIEDSLKGTARAKRGKGVRRRAASGIQGIGTTFFMFDRNKTAFPLLVQGSVGIQPTGETACDH